jgi:hypothetical protein
MPLKREHTKHAPLDKQGKVITTCLNNLFLMFDDHDCIPVVFVFK